MLEEDERERERPSQQIPERIFWRKEGEGEWEGIFDLGWDPDSPKKPSPEALGRMPPSPLPVSSSSLRMASPFPLDSLAYLALFGLGACFKEVVLRRPS